MAPPANEGCRNCDHLSPRDSDGRCTTIVKVDGKPDHQCLCFEWDPPASKHECGWQFCKPDSGKATNMCIDAVDAYIAEHGSLKQEQINFVSESKDVEGWEVYLEPLSVYALYLLDRQLPVKVYGTYVEARCLSCKKEAESDRFERTMELFKMESTEAQMAHQARTRIEHYSYCSLAMKYMGEDILINPMLLRQSL